MSAPGSARPHAAAGHGGAHEGSHVVSVGLYLLVFAALLVLTGLTVWSARHDFGALNTPLALGIAVLKAVLVVLFFMHVKYGSRLVQLIVACAFVWLAIMVVGIVHDYYAPRLVGPPAAPSLDRQ